MNEQRRKLYNSTWGIYFLANGNRIVISKEELQNGFSDQGNTRYYFTNVQEIIEKRKRQSSPHPPRVVKKKKEVKRKLYYSNLCGVYFIADDMRVCASKSELMNGYSDYKGVRYYFTNVNEMLSKVTK